MPERRKTLAAEKQLFFQRNTQPAGNLVRDERAGIERRFSGDRLSGAKCIYQAAFCDLGDMNKLSTNLQMMVNQISALIGAVQSLAVVAERRK